jgi:hypothetical protein
MYALKSLRHILRRPASCHQSLQFSHCHPPKLGGLFRPSLTNRVLCAFVGGWGAPPPIRPTSGLWTAYVAWDNMPCTGTNRPIA